MYIYNLKMKTLKKQFLFGNKIFMITLKKLIY